jgi:hypothetical protein
LGKFRLKWGEREIEYEGEDSDEKFAEAFGYLRGQGSQGVAIEKGDEKRGADQRGGVRRGIFAPAIKKLLDEGFFKLPHKRRVKDITKALENKGLPVKDKTTEIINACRRMLKKDLKGTKDAEGWVFWQD